MSEMMDRPGDADEYYLTWGVSEDQLRLFEQHLQDRYEPGITIEDLSEGELEMLERAYLTNTPAIDEEVTTPPTAQQAKTVLIEELEALFALPDIDEPEIASDNQ